MLKNRKAAAFELAFLFCIIICTLLIVFFYIGAKDKVSQTDSTNMRLVSHQMSQHDFFLALLTDSSLAVSTGNPKEASSQLQHFSSEYFANSQNSASCETKPNALICTLTSSVPLVENSPYQSFYNEGSRSTYSAYVPSSSGKPLLFTLNLWVGT